MVVVVVVVVFTARHLLGKLELDTKMGFARDFRLSLKRLWGAPVKMGKRVESNVLCANQLFALVPTKMILVVCPRQDCNE